MNLNGIWKVEMLTPYGWEPCTTAFMEDGNLFDGGAEHYGVGTYTCDGRNIRVDLVAISHGRVQTMFGKKSLRQPMRFEGQVSKGQLSGVAKVPKSEFVVSFRALRIADLP